MSSRHCSNPVGLRDGIINHPENRPPARCPDPVRYVCRGTDCYLCELCAAATRKSGVVLDEASS